MNEMRAATSESIALSSCHHVIPSPRVPIAIRVATMADLPFMDAMQKKFGRALGYFPTKQFEGYIGMGAVLVARASSPWSSDEKCEDTGRMPVPLLGYIISRDRYLKRDELGVIYQLCVAPGHQRGLIGASLVKEVFERSAYGCRLYCCWCAQDLSANYFWESLGFVPIAFRAGSGKKKRVHIFWQRRIDRDHSVTPSPNHSVTPAPYWYPFQTSSGAIREDRIVFPIPPGVRWQDVRAVAVATERQEGARSAGSGQAPALRHEGRNKTRRSPSVPAPHQVAIIVGGRIKYVDRPGAARPAEATATATATALAKVERPKREKSQKGPKAGIDPTYLAKARELRDRWMERANEQRLIGSGGGKYDVSRRVQSQIASVEPAQPDNRKSAIPALPAA